MDYRITNLAKVLVHYSIKAKKGDLVLLRGGTVAEPLVMAVYEELLRTGAVPAVRMEPSELTESFFRYAKPHHLTEINALQKAEVNSVDALINIRAEENTRNLTAIDPQKQAMLGKTLRPLKNKLLQKRWVLTNYPTQAYAQDAEMSLRDFEDFIYATTFADQDQPIKQWKKLAAMQDRMIKKLAGADEIHIVGPETDLKFSVKGRKFINSAGTNNMPSGEVFTGPVEDSAEGHIMYDFPVCVGGKEIDGVRLVFRKGKVVEASATKNQKYLLTMLDSDPGARRLGELGIGTNMMIQKFIKNILFDEKIGGTIHLALGSSYPETGGKNKSALHWDMIKDLRKGGAVYVDGQLFEKDGKFSKNFL